MKQTLPNKDYTFLSGYQNQQKYRHAFNILVNKIFGISFEDWYRSGYWNEKYIPYTLFDRDKAVANVSVNIMDYNVFGEKRRYIQIGTVLTDEEYRHKNLSRYLMEKVLDEWKGKCDLIYLYANKTVLNMYPKFGFQKVKEYEYFKPINKNISCNTELHNLDMDIQSNREMVYDYAKHSTAFSKLYMHENADLVMFSCLSFLKDCVYYIKSLDAIAIAMYEKNQLRILDIFGKTDVELDLIIDTLLNPNIDQVILGFTPQNSDSYQAREISGDDTLFIQQDKTNLFNDNKIMFPILSHA